MTDVPQGAQYLRKLSVVVANAAGNGIDFAEFRVTFSVRRGDSQTPNSADVRIFNLAPHLANQLATNASEFTQIQIQAGYQNAQYGLIFSGTVKQYRKGRVDQKDSFIDITAADGDSAYNFAAISLTLAANSAYDQGVAGFAASMAAKNIEPPLYISNLPNLKKTYVRGRVFYGMTRDELRDFCATNNLTWSIQDGRLLLLPTTGYLAANPVPVIGVATGLIGVPEQTQQGITFRCLLNPNIKVGSLVKLDSGDINRLRFGVDQASVGAQAGLLKQIDTSADGLYYVMDMSHTGDSRGEEWYTDALCLKTDAKITSRTPLPQGGISPDGVPAYGTY